MEPVRPAPRLPASESLLTDYVPPRRDRDRVWLHVLLFVVTFASMVWAGASLAGRAGVYEAFRYTLGPLDLSALTFLLDPDFLADGLRYAVPFLFFLTVHEFGHYLAARRHGVRVSLPYFLPIPLPGSLGTFGAVIRIREPIRRTRQLFDIGAAGPLAGFAVALGVLAVALFTLPPVTHLLTVGDVGHAALAAEVAHTGAFPALDTSGYGPGQVALVFGDTPLYRLLAALGPYRVPGYELMHYPVLLAGWLGLFFTALNLLPVGQLDGGHVVYALFGPAVHAVVARVTTLVLLLSGGIGLVLDLGPTLALGSPLGGATVWGVLALVYVIAFARLFGREPTWVAGGTALGVALVALLALGVPALGEAVGYWGWLLWVGLILFLIRVDHPPVLVRQPLTPGRKVLGYLCLVIFALSFSIKPIQLIGGV